MPAPQQSAAGVSGKQNATGTSQQHPGSTDESSVSVTASQPDPRDRDNTLGKHVFRTFAADQKAIWTSPVHTRLVDAEWLVPLGGVAAAMFATDTEVSKHLSDSPSRISNSNSLSNYGIASLGAAAGGMYLWGHFTHNDHMRETGFLALEAAASSFADTYALKYAFGRERPLQDNYQGHFLRGGVSFPSEHASAAWSIASVIAHEYPGPLTSVLSYGLAAAVSSARVSGKDHFPSDILVGSALGWFVGQEVYRHHHDPTVGGGDWETYAEIHEPGPDRPSNNVGSPYVELDSWIYPALERLIALGYIDDAILGMRPWTRTECARLVEEAEDDVRSDNTTSEENQSLLDALVQEFTPELEASGGNNRRIRAESLYTRATGISGQPLNRDDFDFGQTLINDYGRPFAEGLNNVTGFSGWVTAGAFAGYVRGEYQHAPSSLPLSAEAREFVTTEALIAPPGEVPLPPATAGPAVNQFQLLDAYVSMTLANWQFSFGKQSLWWGESYGGPLMFSDNAVPVTMFRINRVSPLRLPSILGLLGPLRTEIFLGRLTGHEFVWAPTSGLVGQWGRSLDDQPFIDGLKLDFKPTSDFEFGIEYTTVVGGPGLPFTFHRWAASMFSIGNSQLPRQSSDPGDRRSGIDFTYKIPKMRRWLSLYGDLFNEDEFSPLRYAYKAAFQGGIYLPQIPGLHKLDLRLEGGSTAPVDYPTCSACFYENGGYLNSYTNGGNANNNFGNLMGTWLGRASQGEQVWSTYWLTSRNKIEFNYRHRKIDTQFLPHGGTVNDGAIKFTWWANNEVSLTAGLQYEKSLIPISMPGPQSNWVTSAQITFQPHSGVW